MIPKWLARFRSGLPWSSPTTQWVLAGCATALAFGLSSIPISQPSPAHAYDKLVHLLEYALIGGCYLNLATGGFRVSGWRRMGVALLAVFVLAMVDEAYQSFIPGRQPDWLDVLADSAGAGLFVVAWGLRRLLWRE